nr:hypothetical protein [Tanacetum cinerariifolium]
MVAYLEKPTGSEGFQDIVDFINGSHIRYALTKNLTIHVSLIKKFWQTATVRTANNGEQEITATVNGKEFTVTEASVRRHLQLADADGIRVLPTTEIFDRLSLTGNSSEREGSGHPFKPQPPPSTAQPTNEEPIPNDVSSSHQKTQTPRQALNKVTELPQTSERIPNVADEAIYKEWNDIVERDATTAASLDAKQASDNIITTQSMVMPNVPLPYGIGVCGSPRCQEAMRGSIAQTRSEREESKTAQDLVITRLKLRVEKLEKKKKKARTPHPMKSRLFKVRVESSTEANLDEEDPSKQEKSTIEGIDQDAGVTLVQIDAEDKGKTYTKRKRAVSIDNGGISTASRLFSTTKESVSTVGASMSVNTAGMVQEVNIPSPVAVKDKSKALRPQEELDEEERQKMARVHEGAQSFTKEQWENIRERVEADEELAQRLQAEERNKYNEFDQAKMLVDLINQRKRYFATQKEIISNYNEESQHFCTMETEVRGRASELAARSSQATITDSAEVRVLREMQKQKFIMKVLRGKRLMKLQGQFKNNQMKRKMNCHKRIYNK